MHNSGENKIDSSDKKSHVLRFAHKTINVFLDIKQLVYNINTNRKYSTLLNSY